MGKTGDGENSNAADGGSWRERKRNNSSITVFRAEVKFYIKRCINGSH